MYEGMIPPRAKNSIAPHGLGFFEKQQWNAQVKKNGTNNVIVVHPDRTLTAHNRRGESHKLWEFTPESERIFKKIPGNGYWVLNAELIHSKVKGMRDINYVHDVLVADGKSLVGKTTHERQQVLERLFRPEMNKETFDSGYLPLDENAWLATMIQGGFRDHFFNLTSEEDEGLMLKNPRGKLGLRDAAGCDWMVKCRRTNKNMSF